MKVFIAGPRAINELDNNVLIKLENICNKKYNILIGDANGIDYSVQKFLQFKSYSNVTVFASNGIVRNNLGKWEIQKVFVDSGVTGFNFYAKKDYEMTKEADIGFMIWNGESKGTFNNIINLLELNKEVILYYTVRKKFYHFTQMDEFKEFLVLNVNLNTKLRNFLRQKDEKSVQICLF